MLGVVIRILLRYASAALVAKGILSPDMGGLINGDPDVVMGVQVAVGVAAGLAAEGWYFLAGRFGWTK